MIRLQKSSQGGAVILDALISILIFSIGILAIIGLQAASIRETSAAKYRTDASLLANRVIGQMWVSNKATLATDFASPNGTAFASWASAVAAALPSATGANAPTVAVAGNTVTVTVKWQTPEDASAHIYTATAVITE
jgi:type IV pilus assembly protein PilV